MSLCESKDCTGCMTCVNVCGSNAIKIITDQEGFEYPQIIKDKCMNCNLCTKSCPMLTPTIIEKFNQKYYSCWSKI